jgi:hypothetical protein
MQKYIQQHIEGFLWIIILIILFFSEIPQKHFSICLFSYLNFDCVGCGIGRGMICALKGDIHQSLEYHTWSIFAILVLLYRIFTIFLFNYYFLHRKKI